MKLNTLGYTPDLAAQFAALALLPTALPARVISQHRRNYQVQSEAGELSAILTGGLAKSLRRRSDLPVVGDWVAIEKKPDSEIHQILVVLPRRNKLSRQRAGKEVGEQVIAANINVVLIVTSLGEEFNLRRLERYLAIAHETGANIAIVLNKVDEAKIGLEPYLADIRVIAPEIRTLALSAKTGEGLEGLHELLQAGQTVVLIGSSGVGKSTLINALLGYERQPVYGIRNHDAHGRHTTTSRELIELPEGALIIDNPGLREIQLWIEGDGLVKTFSDIEELADDCRFKDCAHQREPGCAVKRAVEAGRLDVARLENYLKMLRELEMSDARYRAMERKKKGRMYATYRKQIQKRRQRDEKN